ncbi:unnamed protein product, partial [Coregonus sp. 'balchen']
ETQGVVVLRACLWLSPLCPTQLPQRIHDPGQANIGRRAVPIHGTAALRTLQLALGVHAHRTHAAPAARNLAVYVEFRSSDEEVAKPLKCIYGKPGGPVYTTAACSTVLHHSQNPDFYDEVKIELPTQLHEKHHLLFSFYHVTLGYSWLPLLKEGRLASQEFNIPVSCSLPPGYLLVKEPGSTKNGSDLKWVDGGKPIFKVSTNVLSTVYTQLFKVLTQNDNDEVTTTTTRVLVHIVAKCHEENLDHYLHSYIKFVFKAESHGFRTVHEELAKGMTSDLKSNEQPAVRNILRRFPSTYLSRLESLVMTVSDHIFWKNKELAEETRSANLAVAAFVKRCFTLMDRGFTFKLISNYVNMITATDNKVLCEFKFEFLREVCNHEHYIPLSLPLPSARITVDVPEYSLTGEFCRKHFLTGLLLRELGLALQDEQDLRHLALASLKNLMAKHSLDARYAMKGSRDDLSVGGGGAGQVAHVLRHGNSVDASFSKEVLNSITAFSSLAVSTGNHADSRGSLISIESNPSTSDRNSEKMDGCEKFARPQSLIGFGSRFDKLDQAETRKVMVSYWHRAIHQEISDFFNILELCLQHFRFLGKRHIARKLAAAVKLAQATQNNGTLKGSNHSAQMLSGQDGHRHARSQTMPIIRAKNALTNPKLLQMMETDGNIPEGDHLSPTDIEANLSTEVALIVLDVLGLFVHHHKKQLLQDEGQNLLMKKVFDTYLLFFQINQSTSTLRHCCNHRSSSTQTEASALLYFLMRKNFEFTKGKSIVRSHLQNTLFPAEVKDLTKRIRTVLMATSQMKEHEKDPEMLVDLQYSLANSYASTPELRRTWLESMAKIHVRNGDLSEAAMCYIHISALIAESLKRRGYWKPDKARMSSVVPEEPNVIICSPLLTPRDGETSFSMGWAAFLCVSPNVKEEGAMKEDTGTQDTPYTEDTLVEQLELCVDYLWKSERHELIADINKPVIAVFEKRRDFKRLSELYYDIHRSYLKVTEVVNSEKRLFGRYYRVAFYGLGFFEEEESKEFIYKEPKLTGLSEISQRLLKLYSDKFGADNVKMIQDSNKVNPKDLDPKYAYIQVTYVVPYFDDKEQQEKKTDFERHHNINRFVFETPFTLSGKKHGDVEEQCKRRTILTTNSTFPYLKKRIQVVEQQSTEMNPIEVAIDEMSCKVSELNQLCAMAEVDMIRLQLKLQGSVSVKVNAGPMAYARAFLEEKNAKKYPDNQFAEACGQALDVNERLIKEDQLEYQEEMRAHYRDMLTELSTVMNEQV